MKRRELVQLTAFSALATAFRWTPADGAAQAFQPKFFTAHEWETVRVLVDIVIPRDERSGSATEAGVPEFMDFMLNERPDGQIPMRGGIAWLDTECRERFGKNFVDCDATQRTNVLDDIAYPKRAKPEFSNGVAFFNMFRDLTASGFYTSKMGITDLQYFGNVSMADWTGCPDAALRKLGLA